MTVEELIKALSAFKPTMPVVVFIGRDDEIDTVTNIESKEFIQANGDWVPVCCAKDRENKIVNAVMLTWKRKAPITEWATAPETYRPENPPLEMKPWK